MSAVETAIQAGSRCCACLVPRARPPLTTAHRQALEKLGIGGRGGALSSLRTGHRHLFALHALKPATALTAICTMPKPPAAAAALGHYLICPNPNTNWNGRRNANDEGGDGAGDVIRASPCVQVLELKITNTLWLLGRNWSLIDLKL